MPLFKPDIMLRKITAITTDMLAERDIKALLLDLDNTLTTHNNPVPDKDVQKWLHKMRESGIQLVLVSNNSRKRVLPFAGILGLPFTSRACKPLTIGFSRTSRTLGLSPEQIGVVGDQIFTDITGGNLFGALTILVEPIYPETGPFFRFKRRIEKNMIKYYRKTPDSNKQSKG